MPLRECLQHKRLYKIFLKWDESLMHLSRSNNNKHNIAVALLFNLLATLQFRGEKLRPREGRDSTKQPTFTISLTWRSPLKGPSHTSAPSDWLCDCGLVCSLSGLWFPHWQTRRKDQSSLCLQLYLTSEGCSDKTPWFVLEILGVAIAEGDSRIQAGWEDVQWVMRLPSRNPEA